MKKNFFENLNMNDYAIDLRLDEHASEVICQLAKELNLGENCTVAKPSYDSDDSDSITLDLFGDAPKKLPIMRVNYDDVRNSVLGKLKYSYSIQNIHLDDLLLIHHSINFFDDPDPEEFLDLLKSVEKFGIIEPLQVIWDDENNKYMVLNGRSRYRVVEELFCRTGDEKYATVPCIILDSSTSDAMVQGIIIATNMRYRKISRETMMKAVFLLDEIFRKSNKFRSETKVVEEIAKYMGVSRPTVSTYLSLKNLSPLTMDLVAKRHINLSIAIALSSRDYGIQERIIKGLKNEINDARKVRELLEWSYNKEDITDEAWEKKIEETLGMISAKTSITMTIWAHDAEEIMNDIIVKRKRYAYKYLPLKDNSINKDFKVTYNSKHIEQYIKKGLVKQETYDKFRTGVFNKIIKSLA